MYSTRLAFGRRSWPRRCHCHFVINTRRLAVYAMGDGWTGALGTGSLDSFAMGHEDDEEEVDKAAPLLMHPHNATAIAAGWGHTAIVSKDQQLLVCGKPHDFQALLRLKRLPAFMRRYAVQHSLRHHQYNNDNNDQSISLTDKVLSYMVGEEEGSSWEAAKRNSILPSLVPIHLPNNDLPSTTTSSCHLTLDASAGLTAVIGQSGTLYAFGINHHGQCGVGDTSNNVWTPQPVMGLGTEFAHEGRDKLQQEHAIVSVALGLQHGLALDKEGNLYSWGKGERGQLGVGRNMQDDKQSSPHALRITRFRLPSKDGKQQWLEDGVRVTKIAAGMNRSSALTESNHVFVWGKNVAPPLEQDSNRTKVVDSHIPIAVRGLPEGLAVLDIACGSHHTAMLLEDGSVFATGIASDNAQLLFEAVELIPPGVVDMPCRRFDAHFDRTTIVGKDGKQVLQVHLWSDEELQEYAVFTPPWVDHILQDDDTRIQEIQRGWLHTVVSTTN